MNMHQLTLILLVVSIFSPEVLCASKDSVCTKLKQDTFNLWLSVKETCDDGLKDCCQVSKGAAVLGEGRESDVFDIENVCSTGQQPFLSHTQSITVLQARCDLKTDNGGWLVILRRKADVSPLVNFYRSWVEYENGFGDLNTEFWYGLKNIHCLTQKDDVELMIELKQNDGTGETWTYQTFRVDGPETNYVLHIGEADGHGAAFDYMAYHNGHDFSTFDNDNDGSGGNCATSHEGGGWWYNACFNAALTRIHSTRCNVWKPVTYCHYFPHVEMKIRRKNCLFS